jgi:hypothetical protein
MNKLTSKLIPEDASSGTRIPCLRRARHREVAFHGRGKHDYAYPAIEDIGEDNDSFQGQMLSRELDTLYFKGHRRDNWKGAVLTVAPLLLQMTL